MRLWLQVKRSALSCATLLLALVSAGFPLGQCAGADAEDAKLKCQQQLKLLAEALGNYRQDHAGAFPDELGDLLRRYVSSEYQLECPAANLRGTPGPANTNLISPGDQDRMGGVVGYTWEMSRKDPNFWEGRNVGMSFARFKELQRRSLVGKHVPIIRCSHHGDGHVLNLREDGTIYESGEYWEYNFVDQIPVVRLGPRRVGAANQPMSALVTPRPAGATEAMLNLRPWYNARFEDPWVMDDPKKEQIEPDRVLNGGVITNRGIVFDAAGIIQINGKICPVDGWQGFSSPSYPRAVKSITVKRPFRVLHVLGAVQFHDDPGTSVGVVEIHRTGVSPEKWVWRYGRDVLDYRFAVGTAEPRLESTVVAWAGGFVDPEVRKKERPQLFHLRFETAQPGLAVDHLDFLAGDGFSSPFIVGITFE